MQQQMRLDVQGAAARVPPSAVTCCRFLCLNPVSLALSFLVTVIVGTTAGPIAATLSLVAASTVLAAASPLPVVRRLLAPVLVRKRRSERNDRRARRLDRAGSTRRNELDELTGLVAEIEDRDPGEYARLELEELIDLYVEMAILVERYRGAARRSSGLVGDGPGQVLRRTGENRRLGGELVRRRIAHRDACTEKIEELEAELEAVVEFVRLVAQRAVCPADAEPLAPELERRVWELDTREGALRQLSAGEEAGQ